MFTNVSGNGIFIKTVQVKKALKQRQFLFGAEYLWVVLVSVRFVKIGKMQR